MPVDPSRRYVCIHGHFYQPPRENPWLEAVEVQDSAAPYHDWNERVCAEAYAPNAVARLLAADGYITALRNNYERISFNFGPTLLTWMEQARSDVYAEILAADARSVRHFGRGNALAQVYGHCIMPLASPRDQHTQVRWGIADFLHRFGRLPDGMWLPETAVDRTTLIVLAEHGIRFTILAPTQVARVRYAGGDWQPVHDGQIDPGRPYRCDLGGGREIVVFFYDGAIAHGVAFGGLLNDGCDLARRLRGTALAREPGALVHVATDGESYGHHHRFGDMALAAALESLEQDPDVQLTNYAAYLDAVPVRDEVEILENTSWSCCHGVERWRADCGCNAGHPGWQQAWRTPLRAAMEWLKAELDERFERHGRNVFRDPWTARDAYINVLLRGTTDGREAFLAAQGREVPRGPERSRVWKLLEMQRYGLLCFTSCGWFFDEPSGIEAVQVLTYAARAIQLAATFGPDLEEGFLDQLEPVRSNLPQFRTGRDIYDTMVRPALVDGPRLMAHYAIDSLFETVPAAARAYAYEILNQDRVTERSGSAGFTLGRARITALRTEDTQEYMYAALHMGGHDLHCAAARVETGYNEIRKDLAHAFRSEPLGEVVRLIDRAFGGRAFTLNDVFLEERRRILGRVTAQIIADCTAEYEAIVARNRRLLDFLARGHVPVPPELRVAATIVLQRHLEQATDRFVAGEGSPEAVLALAADAERWGVDLQTAAVVSKLEAALARAVDDLGGTEAHHALVRAHAMLDLAEAFEGVMNLSAAQNRFCALVASTLVAQSWGPRTLQEVRSLAERLRLRLREIADVAADAA